MSLSSAWIKTVTGLDWQLRSFLTDMYFEALSPCVRETIGTESSVAVYERMLPQPDPGVQLDGVFAFNFGAQQTSREVAACRPVDLCEIKYDVGAKMGDSLTSQMLMQIETPMYISHFVRWDLRGLMDLQSALCNGISSRWLNAFGIEAAGISDLVTLNSESNQTISTEEA